MEKQLVVFKVEDEFYASDISVVDSIIKMPEITKLPHTPYFVEGVTNLRGTVIPIIDLRKRFGLSEAEIAKETRIIVVDMDNLVTGMIVDAVTEVLRIQDAIIQPLSPLVYTPASQFMSGVAKLEEKLIVLLDFKKVLSQGEQISLQEFTESL
ncbi:MAG: hypothetical protein B6242_04610 [Anaerolineaceae bacterium 4572_78]|nr:MAG: hypothetical protein B6242_04610 [Anaerolineaceae bacterium 4572_78]